MRTTRSRTNPLARNERLIVKEMPGEVLVYDQQNDRAHCLNETAAFVWQHCDGRTPPRRIAQLLSKRSNITVDEGLVWLALDQLAENDLLSRRPPAPASFAGLNRRQMVRVMGLAAVVAVPLVSSIVAPTAAQAATCLGTGASCTLSSQCCSGLCSSNSCT